MGSEHNKNLFVVIWKLPNSSASAPGIFCKDNRIIEMKVCSISNDGIKLWKLVADLDQSQIILDDLD